MSWWQLGSLAQTQRSWARNYYSLPPDACPRCGTPLDVGTESEPGGGRLAVRHCQMGHYEWHGGTRET